MYFNLRNILPKSGNSSWDTLYISVYFNLRNILPKSGNSSWDTLYISLYFNLRNILPKSGNSSRDTLYKVNPRTGHVRPEGKQRYRSTLSLTSAPDLGGCSTPRPGRFMPGEKTRYQLYRTLVGPQGRSVSVRKISPYRDSTPPGLSGP